MNLFFYKIYKKIVTLDVGIEPTTFLLTVGYTDNSKMLTATKLIENTYTTYTPYILF